MAKPGDRVLVEGTKVGQPRREGTLVSEVGRMIKVRWEDGQESLLTPAPGSVQILPGSAKVAAQSGRAGTKSTSRAASAKVPQRKSPTTRKSKGRR